MKSILDWVKSVKLCYRGVSTRINSSRVHKPIRYHLLNNETAQEDVQFRDQRNYGKNSSGASSHTGGVLIVSVHAVF
jgi:phage gp45-like